MRYFLQFLGAIQIALLSQAHAQSVTDDQRMLDYLVETSAAKEASAIAAYRNRSTQLAITELSELVRIYQAIAGIKSLADAERQYWYYMLVIANGRLGRAYGWVPNEKARVESYERAKRGPRKSGHGDKWSSALMGA